MTLDEAVELLGECKNCKFNKKGECISDDECFEAKRYAIRVLRKFAGITHCKDCEHCVPLEKHCEIEGDYYHCNIWRGEMTENVWHKFKKYYRDYSIVTSDDFCSSGVKKVPKEEKDDKISL